MHPLAKRIARPGAGLALLVLLLGQTSCAPKDAATEVDDAPNSIVLQGRFATKRISLEIADDPLEQTLGLSKRDALAPDHGMLFIFEDSQDRAFWMHETHFALDIIFLDADRRIVGIARRATPDSDEQLRVGAASLYVLEVEGGLCDRIGIKEGDRLDF